MHTIGLDVGLRKALTYSKTEIKLSQTSLVFKEWGQWGFDVLPVIETADNADVTLPASLQLFRSTFPTPYREWSVVCGEIIREIRSRRTGDEPMGNLERL
jgi:hypothetical protein